MKKRTAKIAKNGPPIFGLRTRVERVTEARSQLLIETKYSEVAISKSKNGEICPNRREVIVPLKRKMPTSNGIVLEIGSDLNSDLINNTSEVMSEIIDTKNQNRYASHKESKLKGDRKIANGRGYRKVSFATKSTEYSLCPSTHDDGSYGSSPSDIILEAR